MTTQIRNAPAAPAATFPIGLAIASAIVTGIGALAAVYDVQWGVDKRLNGVGLAWVYTNICFAAVFMLVWPCAAMFRPQSSASRESLMKWHLPAIALAALPAIALAAWLSVTPTMVIFRCLVIHAAVGVFMLGLLSWRGKSPGIQATLVGVSAALALAVPLLAYVQEEFLGSASTWGVIGPLVAAGRVASGDSHSLIWWAAGMYAVIGAALLVLSPKQAEKSR